MQPQLMPNLIPHKLMPGKANGASFCEVTCLLWLQKGRYLLGLEGGGGWAAGCRGTEAGT